jgi:arginyl-tRNA synthetase
MIADYANALADKFNTFYNAFPVIKADSQSCIRIALTKLYKWYAQCTNPIGVVAPENVEWKRFCYEISMKVKKNYFYDKIL